MKNSLLILLLLLLATPIFAQQNIRVFLGEKKIDPQSVHFLDPAKIDTIKFAVGASAKTKLNISAADKDSVFVIIMRDRSDLLTYDQVLDLYNVDAEARKFAMTTGYDGGSRSDTIPHPETMLFQKSRLAGITIKKIPLPNIKPNPLIVVMHWYNRSSRTRTGKTLHWLQGCVLGLGNNAHYKLYQP